MINIEYIDPYFEFVPEVEFIWGYRDIKMIYHVISNDINLDKKCKNKQDMLRAMLFYRNRVKNDR